jgi:hypothetical protein
MSARIIQPIDFRLFMPAMTDLTFIAKLYLESDSNAICPVFMASDGTNSYGLYTDADGTTLRMNDPYNTDAAASSPGTLSVSGFKSIGATRSAANLWTPYTDAGAGTANTPASTPAFGVTQIWVGNDNNGQVLDADFGYIMVVPRVLTAAQVAAAMASANPWDAHTDAYIYGTLIGADIAAVMASIATRNGGTYNTGVATRSANDYTFGAALTGNAVLDIA